MFWFVSCLASEGSAEDALLEIEDGYLEFLEAVGDEVDEEEEESMGKDDVAETVDGREQVDGDVRQQRPKNQGGVDFRRLVAAQDAPVQKIAGRVKFLDDLLFFRPALLQEVLETGFGARQNRRRVPTVRNNRRSVYALFFGRNRRGLP